MSMKDMPSECMGAHHCTRENISHSIAKWRKIETGEKDTRHLDLLTLAGVTALQMQWMLSQLDDS